MGSESRKFFGGESEPDVDAEALKFMRELKTEKGIDVSDIDIVTEEDDSKDKTHEAPSGDVVLDEAERKRIAGDYDKLYGNPQRIPSPLDEIESKEILTERTRNDGRDSGVFPRVSSQPQEVLSSPDAEKKERERAERLIRGLIAEYKIRPEEVLLHKDFFLGQLKEKKIPSNMNPDFNFVGFVEDTLRQIAKERR